LPFRIAARGESGIRNNRSDWLRRWLEYQATLALGRHGLCGLDPAAGRT